MSTMVLNLKTYRQHTTNHIDNKSHDYKFHQSPLATTPGSLMYGFSSIKYGGVLLEHGNVHATHILPNTEATLYI